MHGPGRVLIALLTALTLAVGNPVPSAAVWAHTHNGIKHGTTGVDDDTDVWAYVRVFSGARMAGAVVRVGRASDHVVVATTTCFNGCWRIDVHHHPVSDECGFHVYSFAAQRLSGHWQPAC